MVLKDNSEVVLDDDIELYDQTVFKRCELSTTLAPIDTKLNTLAKYCPMLSFYCPRRAYSWSSKILLHFD